ncbi:MAG TPA: TrkA family potassium uptake protein [Lachnospiraceae bacterium]|nr:TrkA family potassium uptake protein [Lachnospiraceae bacterium]
MFKKIKNEKVNYGIVGLGRFGYALARELAASGSELLVLDKDEEKVREIRDLTDNAFVVKKLDKKSLKETGIQNCDVAVVCIGEQMDTSILTTLNLVSMGIPLVISKANSMEHGEILEKLGAEVVYPERDMAIRLASRLETSQVLDFIQLSERINISKLIVPECMIEKTVKDVNLRNHFDLNIIAIENEGTVIESVKPDYIFRQHDILFLSGSKEGLIKFSDWIAK